MEKAVNDKRNEAIKYMIETGKITRFDEIFYDYCYPYTHLAIFMGTNNERISRLINNPEAIRLLDIKNIADFFLVTFDQMNAIISRQYLADAKTNKVAKQRKSVKEEIIFRNLNIGRRYNRKRPLK